MAAENKILPSATKSATAATKDTDNKYENHHVIHTIIPPSSETIAATVLTIRSSLDVVLKAPLHNYPSQWIIDQVDRLISDLEEAKRALQDKHVRLPPKKNVWTYDELEALGATKISASAGSGYYHATALSDDEDYEIEVSGSIPSVDSWKFDASEGWASWLYENDPTVKLNGLEITIFEKQEHD
jgi:hypothetical protein